MNMKELQKIYAYDPIKEKFIIDVQLEDYRDAYSDWDFSPFINRDLDEDLIEFLLECSMEIPLKYALMIDFHILHQAKSQKREERTLTGMKNFFLYQLRKMKNQKVRVFKDIVSFLAIGSVLLILGSSMKNFFKESLLLYLMSEGLFIGGWVMLWEMFSAWFFDMKKLNDKIRHYKRLLNAEIRYSYSQNN
ncbi:MAG: hypothetical protein JXO44_08940 [Clostridia bacterium]|nr:hypothetical protein [Clostridia bacterium]